MKNLNRRELCGALGTLAVASQMTANGQTPRAETLSKSRTFPFDQMQAKPNAQGFISRPVIRGVLGTGETVEMHESTLPPGQMPHPPHKHAHSEFVMIREGQVEFYNDGATEHAGPGGVIFIASNVLHGMKNVGTSAASYFVVAVGKDAAG